MRERRSRKIKEKKNRVNKRKTKMPKEKKSPRKTTRRKLMILRRRIKMVREKKSPRKTTRRKLTMPRRKIAVLHMVMFKLGSKRMLKEKTNSKATIAI